MKTDSPISVDLREKVEAPFSFLSLLISSLSFLFFFFPSFLYFSSWSYPTELSWFAPTLICFFFFSFLPSFFSFLIPPNLIPKVGKFPPHFPTLPLVSFPFFLNFLIFFFLLFPQFDTWLNMSHSFKCYVSLATPHSYHAMCPYPKVPCGIYMVMPCVTRHLMSRKT